MAQLDARSMPNFKFKLPRAAPAPRRCITAATDDASRQLAPASARAARGARAGTCGRRAARHGCRRSVWRRQTTRELRDVSRQRGQPHQPAAQDVGAHRGEHAAQALRPVAGTGHAAGTTGASAPPTLAQHDCPPQSRRRPPATGLLSIRRVGGLAGWPAVAAAAVPASTIQVAVHASHPKAEHACLQMNSRISSGRADEATWHCPGGTKAHRDTVGGRGPSRARDTSKQCVIDT